MDEYDFTNQETCDLVNEEPVAFRGLTVKEMFITLLVVFISTFPLSVIIAIAFKAPWIALIGFVLPLLTVYFLAGFVERFRRGKPPGYLSHFIEIKMSNIKPTKFIHKTYKWGVGRQK